MTLDDNAPEPPKRGTSLWLKILGFGCGGVIVLGLIAVGLVASNWSRLTGYYQQAKSNLSDLMTVQAALGKKYDAEVRITVKRVSGTQGSILSVALVNPPLLDRINMDGPDGRAVALDVATTARDALPPASRYDNYEVVFRRERDAGVVKASGSWEFRFVAADLPPAKPESGG